VSQISPIAADGDRAQLSLASPDGLPVPQRYWAIAAIILGVGVSVLDTSLVNLALPDIARDLGATPSAAVWVVNAFQLAILTALLPCAQLGERIGYRRVYLMGLVVFSIASLACAIAPNLPMLVAARALQGLGAAGLMAVNSALVRLTYSQQGLGRGIAVNAVVVATASVAGPSVAALVLSVTSWHWLFLIQLPLSILTFVLGRRSLPFNEAGAARPRLSLVDLSLNVLMFALVFLGADALGARHGGTDPAALFGAAGLLAAGLVVAWIYIRRQLAQEAPLLPVDLLRIPVFALSMCTSVAAFAAQMLAFITLPFLLLEGQGRGHLEAGLLITAWPAAIVVVAPFTARLIPRYPTGLLSGIGLAVLAVGLVLLAFMPEQASAGQLAWRMAVCGAGVGLFQSPNNHTIVTSAPLHRAGAASGMLGTARLTGQSLGAVIVGVIFTTVGVNDNGAGIALGLAAALAAVASAFSLLRLRLGARARA
jgi:DHA2 family multidrug resistance protein-like MFS transporter